MTDLPIMAPVLWVPLFLQHLAECGVITEAARRTGIPPSVVHTKRQVHPDFKVSCDNALKEFNDNLETMAIKRAERGSDRLLIELLRAKMPEQYRRPENVNPGSQLNVTLDISGMLGRVRAQRASPPIRDVTNESHELISTESLPEPVDAG